LRAVITGSTGFIGAHLVKSLRSQGWEVVTVSRTGGEALGGDHFQLPVTDSQVRSIIRQGDVVVHLAALGNDGASFNDPYEYGAVNAFGTLNVLEACRVHGAAFVLASTQRVYAPAEEPLTESSRLDPKSPYGFSKMVAETWTKMYSDLYGVPAVVLRLFSVYGPGQLISAGTSGVVSIFAHRALANEDMTVHGGQVRDFTYIGDAVAGIEAAMQTERGWGNTYNIASGVAISLTELAGLVKEAAGSSSEVVVQGDYPDQSRYIADISRARTDLGYDPKVSIAEGVRRYIDWLRQR
jgi:UDP-glucose 4-epimerase